MKKKKYLIALVVITIGCAAFSLNREAEDVHTSIIECSSTEPRSGEGVSMTLSCPNCQQLMTGVFKYGYTATSTVICPKCHKHWLVHYDWVSDPQSSRPGHWQKMLRILDIKKS